MKMREFIRENREVIDQVIDEESPNSPHNDRERELWVRNHEGLYHIAIREGVKV